MLDHDFFFSFLVTFLWSHIASMVEIGKKNVERLKVVQYGYLYYYYWSFVFREIWVEVKITLNGRQLALFYGKISPFLLYFVRSFISHSLCKNSLLFNCNARYFIQCKV